MVNGEDAEWDRTVCSIYDVSKKEIVKYEEKEIANKKRQQKEEGKGRETKR